MVIRSLLLVAALALAGCGGSKASSESTTPSNSGGSSGPPPAGSAAGDAKTIQRTQEGGVIELDGDQDAARVKADAEMTAHCGEKNYMITQEGEEATGTDTIAGQPPRTQVAWRVHYQCFGPQSP